MFWADAVIVVYKRLITDNYNNYDCDVFYSIKLYFFSSLFYSNLKILITEQELILLSLLNKSSAI
jgi:hypothetical protein